MTTTQSLRDEIFQIARLDAERIRAHAQELVEAEERGRRAVYAEMLPVLEEVWPWVATAMAGRRDNRPEFDAHPDAVRNHQTALDMLAAARRKAKAMEVGDVGNRGAGG